jgi:hypothetical protein
MLFRSVKNIYMFCGHTVDLVRAPLARDYYGRDLIECLQFPWSLEGGISAYIHSRRTSPHFARHGEPSMNADQANAPCRSNVQTRTVD